MYATFFGLNQAPFSIAPDPHYLFMSERHREALGHLLYGLSGGGGFVLLTGEIGAGKTTVCRCFLEQIPAQTNVAYIFNPKLTVEELLRSICEEFRIPVAANARTVKDFVDPLNRYLLATHAAGQNNVLIIDEAQNLSAQVLEQLRLLTNLETTERKLLQIILIGQPELRDLLTRPELEQLAQRIIARCHLDALSQHETEQYIRHRLAVAGLRGAQPFQAGAIRQIQRLTGGVPRRINLLCDRALLGAYAKHETVVSADLVRKAAKEVFAPHRRARKYPWNENPKGASNAAPLGVVGWCLAAVAVLAGVSALALAGLTFWRHQAASPSPGPSASPNAGVVRPAPKAAQSAGGVSARAVSAVAPPASAPPPKLAETPIDTGAFSAWMERQTGDVSTAWEQLAALWMLTPPAQTEPCAWLGQQGLQCSRIAGNTLPLLRQLDRPGWLLLRGADGRAIPLVLIDLGQDHATVLIEGQPRRLPLGLLTHVWRGDFATIWRMPPGYSQRSKHPQALQAWAMKQLGAAGQPVDTLSTRLTSLQLTLGLPPDGQMSPLTLMQLNRMAAVPEPRLRSHALTPATLPNSGSTTLALAPAASAPTRNR